MRQHPRICVGFALSAFATIASAGTITVNDAGDAGPGNCSSTCTLRDAIAMATAGDAIQFQSGMASPITLAPANGELLIAKALTITGPGAGALTVSASNNSRVFDITANASITDLTIADGAVAGANDTNSDGGAGESVYGACVLVASGIAAVLDRVAIRHCHATGGNGGSGTVGTAGACIPMPPAPPMCTAGGPGGNGGPGGMAIGAAIAVNGSLSLLDSSVSDAHATGGNGGAGGDGGSGVPPGNPGNGGVGGASLGGAVYAGGGASLRIFNSTVAESSGTGGNGGAGASYPNGAVGGIGGYAAGGLLAIDSGATLAHLEFSTLANGSVTGGNGQSTGILIGNAISSGSTLKVLSSIVVGAQYSTNLCYGNVKAPAGAANLSEYTDNDINNPSACNAFSVSATFAQTLKPLDASATPAYMPIWHSPAIDAAANCQDLASANVAADQHGTARPQGAACDLGAIEADYIFVDGFGE